MNSTLKLMLDKYTINNDEDRQNAIKEIMQEITLAGLSRGGFFKKSAFYGGTCLRIFHGLNRFSEDLDFALLKKDESFRLEDYFGKLYQEYLSYGINVQIESKNREPTKEIQSAFIKGNTLMLLITFFPNSEDTKNLISNQKIKVKFEIDTDNPAGGTTEIRYRMLPSPYEVQIFDEPTLFAGKIHAILCREYKNRVKGRDYYDYLFYIGKSTKVNLLYLENKLKASGKIKTNEKINLNSIKDMLKRRFENVDFKAAINDVINFIQDKNDVSLWTKELFLASIDELQSI